MAGKTLVYHNSFEEGPMTIGVEGLGTFPAKKTAKGWAIEFESEDEAKNFIGTTGSPLFSLDPFDPPAPVEADAPAASAAEAAPSTPGVGTDATGT